MTALSLVERGRKVTLLCEDGEPATGASGNRQGALYPLLNGEHDPLSRFYSLAFGYARQRLLALAAAGGAGELTCIKRADTDHEQGLTQLTKCRQTQTMGHA